MNRTLNTLSLFSGIGGLELGLSMAGPFHPVAFCEKDAYARMVLARHWPGVSQYEDICTLTADTLARDGVGPVDVISGGWPCQPHSVAGKRQNSADERDLWSEFARLIGEIEPRWVVGENVPGVLSSHDAVAHRGAGGFFGRVLRDLAEIRYNAEWHCYPASAIGAHHKRNRLFLLAYPYSLRQSQPEGTVTDQRGWAFNRSDSPSWTGGKWEQPSSFTFSAVRRVADGLSARVERLECLGNAVVPYQAAVIGRAITEAEAYYSQFGVLPSQIIQRQHLAL